MRIAIEQGMHTDMDSQYLAEDVVERARETWWTVYTLDRLMSSLLGVPLMLADEDITSRLPCFGGSHRKSLALSILIKVSKATAEIQRSQYNYTAVKRNSEINRILQLSIERIAISNSLATCKTR
jgi:proline utilization trans-activator